MAQNKMILELLKKRSLSPLEALKEVGTMKLATRISELRADGNKIKDRWVDDPLTRKRYKRYWMEK